MSNAARGRRPTGHPAKPEGPGCKYIGRTNDAGPATLRYARWEHRCPLCSAVLDSGNLPLSSAHNEDEIHALRLCDACRKKPFVIVHHSCMSCKQRLRAVTYEAGKPDGPHVVHAQNTGICITCDAKMQVKAQ